MMDWSLHFGATPSWPVLAALLAALVFSLLELRTHWRRRPQRKLAWLGLFSLRTFALLMVSSAVCELSGRVPDPTAQQRRLAVLVDASASMQVSEDEKGEGPRRIERARRAWDDAEDARAAWRAAGASPELLQFGDALEQLGEATWRTMEPEAAHSDLLGALLALQDEAERRSAPLAGVLLLSDGRVAPDDATREQLLSQVEALGVPVSTRFTAREGIRDVGVGPVAAGEFAFVENLTTFEATLYTHGLEGESIELSLRRDGETVARQRVAIGAETERRVRFEVAPEQTGQFVYEIAVTPVEGEATTRNNRRPFVLKVLRDKIRVLHVAGRPDWDVRALRTLLRRDPNVELLSYYILRDEEDSLRSDDSAPMSLIAFPTQELFHEQLGSFDLIVLHNFDALTHGNYLDNLARYVDEGGSLVVIGGDMGLAGGDFARSALESLLPLDLRERTTLERTPFVPQPTEAGRRHPMTAWIGEGQGRGWEGLPALDSFNRSALSPRAQQIGAVALLEGPGGAPLLAVAEPGRGRTLVLATGATWRLGFAPDLPLIDGARPYDLLWLGIVRWVLRDQAAERLRVETDREAYTPHEPIEARVRTLSPSYRPEADVDLRYRLRELGEGTPKAEGATPLEGEWSSDAGGRVVHRFDALAPGAYELEVWRASDENDASESREFARARRVFVVGEMSEELADLEAAPGRAMLQAIAERSGGVALGNVESGGDALPADLPLAEDSRSAVTRTREFPLWNGWFALLALLATLPLEWLLRRRLGLR